MVMWGSSFGGMQKPLWAPTLEPLQGSSYFPFIFCLLGSLICPLTPFLSQSRHLMRCLLRARGRPFTHSARLLLSRASVQPAHLVSCLRPPGPQPIERDLLLGPGEGSISLLTPSHKNQQGL